MIYVLCIIVGALLGFVFLGLTTVSSITDQNIEIQNLRDDKEKLKKENRKLKEQIKLLKAGY